MKTNKKMWASIVLMLIILFAFNQCVVKPEKASSRTTSKYGVSNVAVAPTADAADIAGGGATTLPPGMDMPPMNTPVTETEMSTVDVGVKNFEQINNTMSQLTGVPTSDSNITSVFNDSSIALPSDNNLKNFVPSMQVAITKLATEYCDRLIETDSLRVKIWPSINFNQGPNLALTAANKTIVISSAVEKFFGPIADASADSAKSELSSLYDLLLSGENMTASATTKKVVKGVCVASLSSAYVTLL